MKKLLAMLGMSASLTLGLASIAIPAANAVTSASTVDANFGKCMSGIDDHTLNHYNAPGHANGPLTIVHGELITPNGFQGWVGCS